MSVSVHKLPDEPIIIVTYADPFKGSADVAAANHQVAALETQLPGEFYRIADLVNVHMDWNELLSALQTAAARETGSLRDTRIHSIFVGSSENVALAVRSLSQRQYGSIEAKLFSSVDEALDYARQEIANRAA